MKFDEFSKSDLISGMVLVYRNGELRRLIGKDIYSATCVTKHSMLSWFNEDLTHKANNEYDIVKIYMPDNNTSKIDYIENEDLNNLFKYELVWERVEEEKVDETVEKECGPILTDEEREYLAAVIEPVRDRVEYIELIKSYSNLGAYYITIYLVMPKDSFALFDVRQSSMYKNMEIDKQYTLEELNL